MASPAKATPKKASRAEEPEEDQDVALPEVSRKTPGSGRGAKAKAKAKGKAKAKAKAKKGRGKGKGKPKPSAIADGDEEGSGEAASPKPKPKAKVKPSNFKARVMAEVGERDVDEVIAETRALVASKEAAIAAVSSEEKKHDVDIQKAKTALAAASAAVEQATLKEAVSFEKLKATREASVEAGKGVREAQGNRGDAEKALAVLELEAECRSKMKHLEDAKKQAEEAAAAAKKALEDVKAKEKEASEAAKTALAEQREKEQETLKTINDKQIQLRVESKGAKGASKGLSKEIAQEMKETEKRRAEREKMRVQKMKEVMGGKGANLKSSVSPSKRAASGAESPAKAARVEDVD